MKICGKCGAKMSDDYRFCEKCGEPLTGSSTDKKQTQAKCLTDPLEWHIHMRKILVCHSLFS